MDYGVDEGAPVNVDGLGQIQHLSARLVDGVAGLEDRVQTVQMGVTEPLGQGEIHHGLEDAPAHGGDDGGDDSGDDPEEA